MIRTLNQMVDTVRSVNIRYRIAVAWAQDTNTIGALQRTVNEGFIEAFLIGNPDEILRTCSIEGIDESQFNIIACDEAAKS
ncbi:MAG: hypothetical protein HZB98_10220, partial [Bacteroidia bacterium]|nr:hypothetical protein [Bacteroidia bacterium]